jgi:hypothetical protein
VFVTTSGTALSSVTVLTIDGRILLQAVNFSSGQSIDLSRYPCGIYMLSVRKVDGTSEVLPIEKN